MKSDGNKFIAELFLSLIHILLDGEQGQLIERGKRQETKRKQIKAGKGRQAVEKEQTEERKEPKEPKELKPPEKNPTMKRVYAYPVSYTHLSFRGTADLSPESRWSIGG